MRLLVPIFFSLLSLFFVQCSEECTDCPPEEKKGNLSVKSTPPGASILLNGVNTGAITPDTLIGLLIGEYTVSVHLQYYDSVSFQTNVYENVTTSEEVTLQDGMPPVEILMDYATFFSGDSVRFTMEINQDVLMDSIVVRCPVDSFGVYEYITFAYNKELLYSKDQFGIPVEHILPKPGSGYDYFARYESYFYYFFVYGQKAYGEQSFFYWSYEIGL